jgi:hypothetical protein
MGYPIVDRALRWLVRGELGENPLCEEVAPATVYIESFSQVQDHRPHLKRGGESANEHVCRNYPAGAAVHAIRTGH